MIVISQGQLFGLCIFILFAGLACFLLGRYDRRQTRRETLTLAAITATQQGRPGGRHRAYDPDDDDQDEAPVEASPIVVDEPIGEPEPVAVTAAAPLYRATRDHLILDVDACNQQAAAILAQMEWHGYDLIASGEAP